MPNVCFSFPYEGVSAGVQVKSTEIVFEAPSLLRNVQIAVAVALVQLVLADPNDQLGFRTSGICRVNRLAVQSFLNGCCPISCGFLLLGAVVVELANGLALGTSQSCLIASMR